MTRQDFDKWKEEESDQYVIKFVFNNPIRKADWMEGADAAYNLLSKEIE